MTPSSTRTAFALLVDEARRQFGRALGAVAGLDPVEAPFRIAAAMPGPARLRAYQAPDAAATGPVMLVIPAPIKRAYVWDLLPEVSVVRHALRRGLRVYLLEWLDPGPDEDDRGLGDYAARLPMSALEAIAEETGEAAAVLAGHSLGGTFAAILAALHPERVRGLVLIDAPLAFRPERGGPLARAVAAAPHAGILRGVAGGGPVPGAFTALLSTAAAPEAFVLQRWADLGASLADPLAAAVHARVERWILDEFAMPGRLFEEVLERLYREDRLAGGTLEVGGRRVGLGRLRSPVLAVVNPPGRVVPPESVLGGLAAMPAALPRRVLQYVGEHGPALQHLGPLVGPAAHARLWPEILDWISAASAPTGHPAAPDARVGGGCAPGVAMQENCRGAGGGTAGTTISPVGR
jgi:polyhydroxyalkanoate synthase subunit PhaC